MTSSIITNKGEESSDDEKATVRIGETRMRGEGEGLNDLSQAQVWTYPVVA